MNSNMAKYVLRGISSGLYKFNGCMDSHSFAFPERDNCLSMSLSAGFHSWFRGHVVDCWARNLFIFGPDNPKSFVAVYLIVRWTVDKMAVYAAHLTRTLQGSPSVFQVAAQEALGSTVKPALRKLVEYLAAVYPDKCGWSVEWYDELYLVLDFCLQYHYLEHYAASFSESFYGLMRVPLSASAEWGAGARLTSRAARGSLALLVLLPYARDRAQRLAQRWRERDEDGLLGKSPGASLRRAACQVYSVVHLATEGARLVQLARYVAGARAAPTPALALLGLTLANAPPQHDDFTWTDLFKAVITGNFGGMLSFPLVGSLALRCVEYGAFGVQLLRWWESRGGAPAARLPPPPPPERGAGVALSGRNRCPLCRGGWRAPAALPASGLAYCYACIAGHLRRSPACPVTGLPATERDLIRIYID